MFIHQKAKQLKTKVKTAYSLSPQNQGLFNNCELSDQFLQYYLQTFHFAWALFFHFATQCKVTCTEIS